MLLLIVFSSCYKYETIDYDYENYNRLVGPQGGHINFFYNYGADTNMLLETDTNNIIVELDVPEGALDSNFIFNFYTYEDFEVADELSKGLAMVGTKFFYFVPIPESEGYHEHEEADLSYHYSMNFNKPITVKFHFKVGLENETNINSKRLKYEYYNMFNANYRLYRIKIPRIDEWSNIRNVFVQWNRQGYPVGYMASDLYDIILGYWYPFSTNQVMSASIINWSPVDEFEINPDDNSVEFQINNSDYMYVLARITQIPVTQLPVKIKLLITDYFNIEIIRAAFIEGNYFVLLEDHSVARFSKKGDFISLEKYNVPFASLPNMIKSYLITNYHDEYMQGNIFTLNDDTTVQYQINFQNGECLVFNNYSGVFEYVGKYVYTDDFSGLPQSIKDYIDTKYPDATYTNLLYQDDGYEQLYVVYIGYQGKHIKLFVSAVGDVYYSIYYGLKKQDIPDPVSSYIDSVFNGLEIKTIELYDYVDSSEYQVIMLNEGRIDMKPDGTLIYADYPILVSEVPEIVNNAVADKFTSSSMISARYLFFSNIEYELYYVEDLFVDVKSSGKVIFAMGTNFYDLPENARTYIIDNYSEDEFGDFFYDSGEYSDEGNPYYVVTLQDNTILFFDDDGNYEPNKKVNLKRRNQAIQKYQQFIQNRN